jgi:Fe-S-cluster containining protein
VTIGKRFLSFRCTGCGNCCREPLLPLTDSDLRRIVQHTGERPEAVIRWVDKNAIDLDDEPENFALLRQGKRVMVLAHTRYGCRYLGADDRCTIYTHRPLGCRAFPFDPVFAKDGKLRRLALIPAAECEYELDGKNDPDRIRSMQQRLDRATDAYHQRIAAWNRAQALRRRHGLAAETSRQFLAFLGF